MLLETDNAATNQVTIRATLEFHSSCCDPELGVQSLPLPRRERFLRKCANTIRSQGENNENLQIGTACGIRADVYDCGDCSRGAHFDFQVQDHPGAGSANYNCRRD